MYSCRIIKDSISDAGTRLTTYEVCYPRMVHQEMLTHRVFSRNSASSRAIPVSKMLSRIKEDPAMPVYWGKNQAGMQAAQELHEQELEDAKAVWLEARDSAVEYAEKLQSMDVHKQLVNRITEPWMWITVLVTSTTFTNWDKLRDHKDAQPEIRHLAAMMVSERKKSDPTYLRPGDFHLPFWQEEDEQHLGRGDVVESTQHFSGTSTFEVDTLQWVRVMVSSGRAARLSYLTHHGKRDLVEDGGLARRLIEPGHMSPFEHAAMAMSRDGWNSWVRGEFERHMRSSTHHHLITPIELGNFVGWKQARKFISGESGYTPAA